MLAEENTGRIFVAAAGACGAVVVALGMALLVVDEGSILVVD
jgi:hypothetical protein